MFHDQNSDETPDYTKWNATLSDSLSKRHTKDKACKCAFHIRTPSLDLCLSVVPVVDLLLTFEAIH